LPKEVVLTPAGFEKLRQELEYLSTVRRQEIAEQIRRAVENAGDLTDNTEYLEAKSEQARLEHRIALLEERLAHARVVQPGEVSGDFVGLGSRVVLRDVERGTAVETPQDHSRATFAPKIEKSEGEIRFDAPARAIYDKFRAFDPWPGLFFEAGGETIKLTDIRPIAASGEPGSVVSIGSDGVVVAAGDGAIRIVEMQRPNKARAAARDVARGLGWRPGTRLR